MANIPMPLRDAQGMQLPPQFDPVNNQPYYLLDNGAKQFLTPMQMVGLKVAAQTNGPAVDPRIDKFLHTDPNSTTAQDTSAAEALYPKGSFFRKAGGMNTSTGNWEKGGINWGNILSLAVGGALTGGAMSAFMAAPAAAAAPTAMGTGGLTGATTVAPSLAATIPGAGAVSGAGMGAAAASGATAATTGAAATGGALASSAVPGAGAVGAVPGALSATGAGMGTTGGVAAGAQSLAGKYLTSQLIPTGGDALKAVGGYLQGRAQSKSDAQQRADALLMNQQKREDEMRTQIANFLASQQTQRLNATQMDPYAQAKSLNSLNVRRSFDPNAGANSNFDLSAMSPTNLASENAKFQGAANDTTAQKQIMDYLSQNGGPNTKVCYDPKNGTQIPCPTAGVQ